MAVHTDTQNKNATGSANYPVSHTDKLTLTTGHDADKALSILAARFALVGRTLARCSSSDGSVMYHLRRWGLLRYLPTLYDAGLFLAKIGGRL